MGLSFSNTILFFCIQMKSKTQEARSVSVSVIVSAVTYTGGTGSTVKKGQDSVHLTAGADNNIYRASLLDGNTALCMYQSKGRETRVG